MEAVLLSQTAAVLLLMAKAKVTRTTKSRKRKTGGSSGFRQCNMCHGTGRIKNK